MMDGLTEIDLHSPCETKKSTDISSAKPKKYQWEGLARAKSKFTGGGAVGAPSSSQTVKAPPDGLLNKDGELLLLLSNVLHSEQMFLARAQM